MSETTTKPATRAPKLLAEYDCDEGRRQLVGQRVDGAVRSSTAAPAGAPTSSPTRSPRWQSSKGL